MDRLRSSKSTHYTVPTLVLCKFYTRNNPIPCRATSVVQPLLLKYTKNIEEAVLTLYRHYIS